MKRCRNKDLRGSNNTEISDEKRNCVKCSSPAVCTAELGLYHGLFPLPLGEGLLSGVMSVKYQTYACSDCGLFEQYIIRRDALDKIAELAAGKVKGWSQLLPSEKSQRKRQLIKRNARCLA